jgi:hypothetical protein
MSDKTEEPRASIVNQSTLVPMAVLGSAILLTAGIVLWLSGKFTEQATHMDAIATELRAANATLSTRIEKAEEKGSDRLGNTEFALWVSEARRLNPTLSLPPAAR